MVDVIKLFRPGILIGIPVANYWVFLWLEGFAYRMHSPWGYVVPGFMVLLIVLFTISKLSFQTAKTNPVDSLRDE